MCITYNMSNINLFKIHFNAFLSIKHVSHKCCLCAYYETQFPEEGQTYNFADKIRKILGTCNLKFSYMGNG